MQRIPIIKCISGNNASFSCNSKKCNNPALMCDQNECYCLKLHQSQDCKVSKRVLSDVIQIFRSKSQQIRNNIIIPILEWFDVVQKRMTIYKHQFLKIFQQTNIFLLDKQCHKMYQKLENGPAGQVITSSLMSVCESIISTNLTNKTKSIISRLKQGQNIIQQKLKQIKSQLKLQQHQNEHLFISELCDESYKISKNGKVITMNGDGDKIAILSKSIQQYSHSQQFRFKILKIPNSSSYDFLGLCFIQQMKKNKLRLTQQAIICVTNTYGQTFNCCYQQQSILKSDYKHQQGDVIQITYNPIDWKVTFKNVTKKLQHSMNINTRQNDKLHLFVCLTQKGRSIEYLESK